MTKTEPILRDEELLQRATSGDPNALERLLGEKYKAVLATTFAITGNREDALDAAQCALINLWRVGIDGGPNCGVDAWVYSCAHNAAVDLVRTRTSRRARDLAANPTSESNEVLMPPDKAALDEALEAVREELAALPPQTAILLELHHLGELTLAEVSRQTGMTVDACKQRLSRGRTELRERLERRGVNPLTLAALPGAFESLRAEAHGWALRIDPAEHLKIAKSMAARRHATGARGLSSVSSNTPDGLNQVAKMQREFNRDSRSSHSTKRTLVAAALLCLACGAVVSVNKFVTQTRGAHLSAVTAVRVESASVLAPTSSQPTPDGHALRGLQPTTSASHARVPGATPRWQIPRFIAGSYLPLAIAANGTSVALLLQEYKPDMRTIGLRVVESSDGGQTWSGGSLLEGYGDGAVSIDEKGNCIVLAMAGATGRKSQLYGSNTNSDCYARVDWLLKKPGGTFSIPQTLWNAPPGEEFIDSPKLIPVARSLVGLCIPDHTRSAAGAALQR